MTGFSDLISWLIVGALVSCSTCAGPSDSNAAGSLVVKTTSGSFQGFNTGRGLEAWLGLPFAEAPVGDLRFKAPVSITKPSSQSVQNASAFGHACPQPDADLGAAQAEDCLFLNVWRPAGTAADAKLPILFWIHGGAYTSGAASDSAYDPTVILNRSVTVGKPIIFVSTNYRLNTFGFLASATVPLQYLNAGLLDQHAALQFVKSNAASFGGDPSKVTIWGQSAGAGSVEALLLFPPKPLTFRAAIADSSTGPFKSAPFPQQYDAPGKPFARLLSGTNCAAGPGAVACLRKVDFQTLRNLSNAMIDDTLNGQLWQPTIAPGSLFPKRPSKVIESGDFARVSYLAGTNLNEGNTFSHSTLGVPHTPSQEDALFDNFIGNLILDNTTLTSDVLNRIHQLYPANDSSLGAPFNTGDSLFDRSAAWYGDNMFLAPRRFFFDRTADKMPMFAYHFREFLPGDPVVDGVSHASELGLLFGTNTAPSEVGLANNFTDSYINFVNDMNPGAFWPTFNAKRPEVMQIMKDNITLIPDDFNLEKTNFLNTAEVLNEFEK